MGFHFFFIFRLITLLKSDMKYINLLVSSFILRLTQINQRVHTKCKRQKKIPIPKHTYVLYFWVNENLRFWSTRVLQDLKSQHAAAKNTLSFVAPHTSLTTREPGDRNPPLRLWKSCIRLLSNWIHETRLVILFVAPLSFATHSKMVVSDCIFV